MSECGGSVGSRADAYTDASADVQLRVDQLCQSPEDRRQHRAVQLTNGMRVMLVSDKETDKAAAALTVQVGSLSDPADIPGLAHFCEHMLFMGTERYPDESEYSKYITEHGGSSNAFTTADKTSYYFDVGPDHFEPALDRFAQFFICPVFDISSTEREISAVNAEHERNVTSDVWRLRRAESVTCRAGHAQRQFSTGNRASLTAVAAPALRERLFAFHRQWYSAALMAVTLVGRESLDQLQRLAVDKLAAVVRHAGVEAPSWPLHALGAEQLGSVLRCVPLKQVRRLKLQFALPDLSEHFASKPADYVSHLVGHEGAGSVYAELRRRGWATALEAGSMRVGRGYGLFYVSVELTSDGEEDYNSVVCLIFEYIDMLRRDGPQRWIFDECAQLRTIAFRFKDVERPIDYAVNLSQWTLDLPMDRILDGKHVIDKFEPELIAGVLELLRPENARLVLFSKSQSDRCTETEQWYGVRYGVERLTSEQHGEWSVPLSDATLHLPSQNEFIATDFSLLPERRDLHDDGGSPAPISDNMAGIGPSRDSAAILEKSALPTSMPVNESSLTSDKHYSEPQLVIDTPLLRAWHHSYRQYQLPKAVIRLNILTPLVYSDPNLFNIARIFSYLLLDSLNECVYSARLADLQLDFFTTRYGFQLYAAGFSHKLPLLVERAVSAITSFSVDRRRFSVLHAEYLRRLRNHDNEQPAALSGYWLTAALLERVWDSDTLTRSAATLTADTIERVWPLFWRWLHVECLIAGNLSSHHHCSEWLAPLVSERLASALGSRPIEPELVTMLREVQLPLGRCTVLERPTAVHATCGVSVYLQCGVADLRSRALLELLVQLMREPAFDQLRTVEQLGYIVNCCAQRTASAQGLLFTVQSDKPPEFVESRIEAFLLRTRQQLEQLSKEELEQQKAALAVRKLERPKSLLVAFLHDWIELSCRQYCFGRAHRECQELARVDLRELVSFFTEHVLPEPPAEGGNETTSTRRRMIVRVRPTSGDASVEAGDDDGNVDKLNNNKVDKLTVADLAEFKLQRPLLPHVRPYRDLPVPRGEEEGSPGEVRALNTSVPAGTGPDLTAKL